MYEEQTRRVVEHVIVQGRDLDVIIAQNPQDRKEFWTLDGDTIRWIGVVLFTAGSALRLWPVFVLGHRFSRSEERRVGKECRL